MRVLFDDAGDVPAELIQSLNIAVIPVNVIFGDEEYLTGVTIDRPTFYEKTKQVDASNFPKTSQPTPYQFEEAYKEILATSETEILTITVSEKLSGTYRSAQLAAKELAGQGTFHIFDSRAGSAAQGYMVIEAARMAQGGNPYTAIEARLREMRDNMAIAFTIDSLEYAVKGGRVSSLQSFMASLLNIKPILSLTDGVIEPVGRVRTRKKAMSHIVEMVAESVGGRPVQMAVIHANAPEDAARLRQMAQMRLDTQELIMVDMAVPVVINLGPGALGLVAVPV